MIAIQTTKNYKSPWLEIKASVKMRGRTLCTASRAAPRWTQLLLYYFCWDKTLRISSRGDNPQWAQLYQGERGSRLLFRNADAMKTRAKELSRWKPAPKSSEASATYGYKLEPAAQRGNCYKWVWVNWQNWMVVKYDVTHESTDAGTIFQLVIEKSVPALRKYMLKCLRTNGHDVWIYSQVVQKNT